MELNFFNFAWNIIPNTLNKVEKNGFKESTLKVIDLEISRRAVNTKK